MSISLFEIYYNIFWGDNMIKFKELREDNDLTQTDIAKILNCKQNTYQQYESGKRQMPTQAIVKLCLYYGISSDYILGLPKGLKYPER